MSLKTVAKLYEDFRERRPRRARKISRKLITPSGGALMIMGYCDGITYRTSHGSKTVRYKHSFAAGSRALLCTDGKRLFLVGGRFHVTERGIVDLSPRGNEIEDGGGHR